MRTFVLSLLLLTSAVLPASAQWRIPANQVEVDATLLGTVTPVVTTNVGGKVSSTNSLQAFLVGLDREVALTNWVTSLAPFTNDYALADNNDTISGVWTYDNASFLYSRALIFSSSVDTNYLIFRGGGAASGILSMYGGAYSDATAAGDVRLFAGSSAGEVEFWIGSSRHVTLARTGRLGIGTNAPSEKLEVVGNAKVSGSIEGATVSVSNVFLTPVTSPAYTEGLLFYDADNDTLKYYNDEPDVAQDVGRELWVKVRNNSGATITNGSVVYISGATGQNPTIALAKADVESTSRAIAVATHDIENNSLGYVTTFGIVRGVDTTYGADGVEVFLSATTAGALTNAAPTGTNVVESVGYVAYSHGSNGKLLVSITPHVDVDDIHGDLLITQTDQNNTFDGGTTQSVDVLIATNVTVEGTFDLDSVSGQLYLPDVTNAYSALSTTFTAITNMTSFDLDSFTASAQNASGTQLTNTFAWKYLASWGLSFGGAANEVYEGALFVDGSAVDHSHKQRKTSNADRGDFGTTCHINLTAGQSVDLRVKSLDASAAFTAYEGQLTLTRIGR